MIPDFDTTGNLPPGIHAATWADVLRRLGTSARRQDLLRRLRPALAVLHDAGCACVYLAGSFVSAKAAPGDIDVLWDPAGVDTCMLAALAPVLADASPPAREVQKVLFGAEFIPLTVPRAGLPYLEFFQTVKETDAPRGIVRLDPGSP